MALLIFIVLLLGLSLGSFANCLIWRLYKQERVLGRSYCPLCKKQIVWYDNIPLLSYIFLGGRCRQCKKKISWQYPLVEFAVAALFLLFWFKNLEYSYLSLTELSYYFENPRFWLSLIFDWLAVWVLTVVFVFDLRYYLVSTILTVVAAVVFLALNYSLGVTWYLPLITMAGGAAFFGLQFLATRGKGIGEGDIWLGLMLGAMFVQVNLLILAIFASYIIGTIIALGLLIAGKKAWSSKLPLGVFLALGGLFALIWGNKLLDAYWAWFQL
ncbi:hypothetical protein CVU83_03315 [Candidatus Falkowbacteria bacterium HGW-Falkowbacteria-2]|uniref:Uncharacterized protein n=1 Tax=Candidatus Falkowbacteria bacterium HGW-Falkowbacteria-2 TaxID=2013769 RepID=A0A2N2DXJ4_9BACT|nr:MAG: hypothetical protein CVU83_03315 [Candidatus Falkowbacteria bacterium HGW-Falkowbacteria-2]